MLVACWWCCSAINYSIYAAYHDIYLEEAGGDDGESPVKEFGFEA